MPIHAIIFDLDGTLLDTLEDLADAANACLLAQGFSAHPVDAYRQLVGDGVETLFRRALPPGTPPGAATETAVAALVARMGDEYGARWSAKSAPYPGIRELLAALAPAGLPLGVLSNKPHAFTRLMVGSFFDGAGCGGGDAPGGAPNSAPDGAPDCDGPLGPFAVVAGARGGGPGARGLRGRQQRGHAHRARRGHAGRGLPVGLPGGGGTARERRFRAAGPSAGPAGPPLAAAQPACIAWSGSRSRRPCSRMARTMALARVAASTGLVR